MHTLSPATPPAFDFSNPRVMRWLLVQSAARLVGQGKWKAAYLTGRLLVKAPEVAQRYERLVSGQ